MEFIVEESIPIDDQKPHKAELVDIKQGTSDSYGDYLRFLFRLVDTPDHTFISGICPAQLSVGNKFYSWLSVLKDSNLEVGEKVNLDQFKGCVVQLTVKNIQNDGRTFTNVESLVRLINYDGNVVQ